VFLPVIPAQAGTQGVWKDSGFPSSSAGQALLEFIPMEIGAGMTPSFDALIAVAFQKAKLTGIW